MGDIGFLQIFLGLNLLVIGAAAALAVQHAHAHFRPHDGHPETEKPQPKAKDDPLPADLKDKLLQASQTHFQTVLDKTVAGLEHDLSITAAQMNHMLQKMASEVIGAEMKRYQTELAQLRTESEGAISGAKDEIGKHQEELKAKYDEELARQQTELKAKFDAELAAERTKVMEALEEERQQLVQLMDSKLADAVASFLMETLPHNVDLGAQAAYLTSMLEAHKAELVREVSGEK